MSSGAKTCTKAYHEFLCGLDVIPETFGREEDVTKIKTYINDFFLNNNGSGFLRIIGESGIGKTRLVLELLKDEFPLISIYYEQASLFKNLRAFLSQNQQINGRIVIVLDECDEKFIDDLSNRPATSAGVKIFFICINNQKDSYHHQIPLIEINSLDRQSIQQILFPEKNNRLNQHNQERWAEMCGGSPYVASTLRRLIAEKVIDLENPDLSQLDKVWNKILFGERIPNEKNTEQQMTMLRSIALFLRFGESGSYSKEKDYIFTIITNLKGAEDIKRSDFDDLIERLKKRKILKGDYTLQITPKLLHIWLWSQWWENYSESLNLKEGWFQGLPQELQVYFHKMFQYAKSSEGTKKITQKLLSEEGPFRQNEKFLLSDSGSGFFLILSETDPEQALDVLKQTIYTWDKDKLLNLRQGRRSIIFALEKIAVHKDLCLDALRILLKLAEAENESCNNNATGIFIDYFMQGYGQVAMSQLAPVQRLKFLTSIFEDPCSSDLIKEICLNAFNKSLTLRITRWGIPFEEANIKPWTPKDDNEYQEGFFYVLDYLREKLNDSSFEKYHQEIFKILNLHLGEFIQWHDFKDKIFEIIDVLSAKCLNKDLLLDRLDWIKKYADGIPHEDKQKIDSFIDRLYGSGFKARFQKYVLKHIFTKDEKLSISKELDRLAKQISKMSPNEFSENFNLLVQVEAASLTELGSKTAKYDRNNRILDLFLSHFEKLSKQNSFSCGFLTGYISSSTQPEKLLEKIYSLHEQKDVIPFIIAGSTHKGISGMEIERLIKFAKEENLPLSAFQSFHYGGTISNSSASEKTMNRFISFIAGYESLEAFLLAIDIFYSFYYLFDNKARTVDANYAFKLLKKIGKFRDMQASNHLYSLFEIANKLINLDLEKSLKFADFILKNISSQFFGYKDHYIREYLKTMIEKDSQGMWNIFSKYILLGKNNWKYENILSGNLYLHENSNELIKVFNKNDIFDWIDGDLEKRAVIIASFIPRDYISYDKGEDSFTKEFIQRYGNIKAVRDRVSGTLNTGSFTGSLVAIFDERVNLCKQYLKNESDKNIKKFLEEHLEACMNNLQRHKEHEERDLFWNP